MKPIAAALCIACALAAPGVVGADDPKQRQDLTAVIALNGKPCGEVTSYTVSRRARTATATASTSRTDAWWLKRPRARASS